MPEITDWFTIILYAAGLEEPKDRVIDGINRLDRLTGREPSSLRDGYIYWMGSEMYGVKWRNFTLVLVAQRCSTDSPPGSPRPGSST